MYPPVIIPAFFDHRNLSVADYERCMRKATLIAPAHAIETVENQGGCSFALIATREWETGVSGAPADSRCIIQFRPLRHAVRIDFAREAEILYPPWAPRTSDHGYVDLGPNLRVQICSLKYIPGLRFADVQPTSRVLDGATLERLESVVTDLAHFFARGWHTRLSDHHAASSKQTGRVGSTMHSRLRQLASQLPSADLRRKARRIQIAVRRGGLELLPDILTHGDLIPSNLLVNEECWRIRGVIDWAEAEYLAFGFALYGLDHLLGYMEELPGARSCCFVRYEQAEMLRAVFWRASAEQAPELRNKALYAAVMLARDVGVLMHHGFAWDDGKIDRVVDTRQEDAMDLEYLTAFLDPAGTSVRRDSGLWIGL